MKLNAKQQKAVDCNDKKILCLACAGAGKTQVLISRLWRLVSQDKVDPRKILCLTFTRAAALEMRERYAKLQKTYEGRNAIIKNFKPEINTFHAFCYSLVMHDHIVRRKVGYARVPAILDPALEKNYQNEAIIQTNTKLPKRKLKRNAIRTKPEQAVYKLYEKAYRRLLLQDNLITFDILCSDVCRLFHFHDESVKDYQDKYKHIFVDEFQDTDYTQVSFVESFEDASWFCVGDALQNLYSFRGTSNRFIKEYSHDDSWTKIRMNQNYRSTKQICEYANDNSLYADSEYRIELFTDVDGSDVLPITINSKSTTDIPVPKESVDYIMDLLRPGNETAILCRTNAEVDYLSRQLKERGIECSSSKKDITTENILKSTIDNDYLMDWLSTLMSSEVYANYIRLKALEENPSVNWFVKNFGHIYAIRQHLIVINNVRSVINTAIAEKKTCQQMIDDVIEFLGLDIPDGVDCAGLSRRQSVNALIDTVSETRISGVYCGTVHSVKGLEFQDVIVVGVDGRYFRLVNEDNLNIFYVAITRAKERLAVLSERD